MKHLVDQGVRINDIDSMSCQVLGNGRRISLRLVYARGLIYARGTDRFLFNWCWRRCLGYIDLIRSRSGLLVKCRKNLLVPSFTHVV